MALFDSVEIKEQDFSQKFNTPGIKKVTFDKVELEQDVTDDYKNSYEVVINLLFNQFNETGEEGFVPSFAKIEFKLKNSNDEKEFKSFLLSMSNVLACFFDGKPLEATNFIKKQTSWKKLAEAISSLFAKNPIYYLKIRRGVITSTGKVFHNVNIRANHPCLHTDPSKIFYSDERDNDRIPENSTAGMVKAQMGEEIKSDDMPF